MRLHTAFLMLGLLMLAACSATPGGTSAPISVSSVRTYNGTASVGDFLTISVDSTASTITYSDVSNGQSGIVPYTVNANGTYTLNDAAGNLLAAYEIPGYAMVIQAAKAGPNKDTPALITAVETGQITLGTFEGNAYNYMQFRTAAGGVEVGSISINMQGLGANSSYWPFGALGATNGGQSPFHTGNIDLAQAKLDPTGTYMTATDGGGSDTIFGTANGIFAVDTPNGAILGLLKAGAKDFDASVAGTYTAIYYQKTDASTGVGNVETGTPSLGTASMTVSSAGVITVTDSQGGTMAQGTLIPVADAAYLYGSNGELTDPCFGIFTIRLTVGAVQQDVFVSFLGQSAIFSSFSAALPSTAGETYAYFYGVGLKSQ
jgi:hypothetical protein